METVESNLKCVLAQRHESATQRTLKTAYEDSCSEMTMRCVRRLLGADSLCRVGHPCDARLKLFRRCCDWKANEVPFNNPTRLLTILESGLRGQNGRQHEGRVLNTVGT
jgi:hypothetical protein